MSEAEFKFKELQYKKYELVLKAIAVPGAMLVFLVGIQQFNTEQRNKDQLEYKRRMMDKRMEVYSSICKNSAMVVNTVGNDSVFKANVREFNYNYWSSIIYIRDPKVSEALIDLRIEIQDYTEGIVHLDEPDVDYRLKYRLKKLSDNCAISLQNDWIENEIDH